MGRSQLTVTDKLNRLTTNHFGNYRRTLMGLSQRRAFDELFSVAKNNRMAISQAVDVLPVDACFMTMIIELKLEIKRLEKQVQELQIKKDQIIET